MQTFKSTAKALAVIIGNLPFQLCLNELEVITIQQGMFEIKCTQCGKAAFVPFHPTPGKPAYCRDCFSKISPKRNEPSKGTGEFERNQVWARRRNPGCAKETVRPVSNWILSTKE
jgi:CxxC-x17-CxxC domain-containing protein